MKTAGLAIIVTSVILGAATPGSAQTTDLWYLSFHGGAAGKQGVLNNLASFDTTGALVSTGVLDDSQGELRELRGFIVLPDGALYVANAHTGDSKIFVFGPPTSATEPRPLTSTFVQCDDTANPGLQHPFALVIGPDQLFYVANQGNSSTPSTTNAVTRYVGLAPTGTPGPVAAALGPGTFYPGTFVAPSNWPGATTNGVNTLRDLVFGPDGDLYVADEVQGVREYRGPIAPCVVQGACAEGAFVQTVVPVSSGSTLGSPAHLLVSPDATQLYIGDEGNNQILRYTFPIPPSTLGAVEVAVHHSACKSVGNGLDAPAGMAIGTDGALYVVTRKGRQILKILNYQGGSSPVECSVFVDLPTASIEDNPEFIRLVTIQQATGGDPSAAAERPTRARVRRGHHSSQPCTQ